MKIKNEIMDESAIRRAIARISYEILERNQGADNLCIIGVLRRGSVIAQRIASKIEEVEGRPVDIGTLDITPFRDDRKQEGQTDQSALPFPIEGRTVVLVDDVLYTGRSVRAAIDALMSRGRPQSIQLATLIDRGHRELPIRPDYVGKNIPTSKNEDIKVMVPEYDGACRVVILSKESG